MEQTIGDRIVTLRKAVGLSQEQLAEVVGVSRQAISKWETNQSLPEVDKLVMLGWAFSVSVDELLGNTAPPKADAVVEVKDFVRANHAKRLFTAGWVTALVGVFLLVAELIALPFIRTLFVETATAHGMGFQTDVSYYATHFPMNIAIGVAVAVIVVGVLLAAFGLFHGRRK